jgi:hypothetical protein
MAIVRITDVIGTGAAINLNLGFVPNYIRVLNQTKWAAQAGVAVSEWFSVMPNGYALQQTLAAGAPTYSQIVTNGFTPFQTPDSQLFVTTNMLSIGSTNLTITGITQAAQASVTVVSSPFTAQDVGVTTVTFHNVSGMNQINTLSGVVQSVGVNTFTVNINTTNFSAWTSGGVANVITGEPPVTKSGFQYFNTPLLNNGQIGITLGTGVAGSLNDVLLIEALLDASFTSD